MSDIKTTNLPTRLRSIADAGRRQDGTDIPLGIDLRAAADEIDRLQAVLREIVDGSEPWAIGKAMEALRG